jgi:hypothetical protein
LFDCPEEPVEVLFCSANLNKFLIFLPTFFTVFETEDATVFAAETVPLATVFAAETVPFATVFAAELVPFPIKLAVFSIPAIASMTADLISAFA